MVSIPETNKKRLSIMFEYLNIDAESFLVLTNPKDKDSILADAFNTKLRELTTYEEFKVFLSYVQQFYGVRLVGKRKGHLVYGFRHLYDFQNKGENPCFGDESCKDKVSYIFNNGDTGESYVRNLHENIRVR